MHARCLASGDSADGVDKSVLAIATPRRYRDREYLRYVAQQVCLVCGRMPSDPNHLRYLPPPALGRKASGEFAVPLCRILTARFTALAMAGLAEEVGIDPIKVARKLWKQTRVNEGRIQLDGRAQGSGSDQTVKSLTKIRERPCNRRSLLGST